MEGHIPQANRKAEQMWVSISDLSMLEQRRLQSRRDLSSASLRYHVFPRPACLSSGLAIAHFLGNDIHDSCMRFQSSFVNAVPVSAHFLPSCTPYSSTSSRFKSSRSTRSFLRGSNPHA